jgi:hypothetical protein
MIWDDPLTKELFESVGIFRILGMLRYPVMLRRGIRMLPVTLTYVYRVKKYIILFEAQVPFKYFCTLKRWILSGAPSVT